MGYGGFNSNNYNDGVKRLRETGQTFQRTQQAQQTGNFNDIADILNPRLLKNGVRECTFAPGFNDALSIIVGQDLTGSMDEVPLHIQKNLQELMIMIKEQGISDRPNILFMGVEDENSTENATFQISQFETEAEKLIQSLNEMIIPGLGGRNRGESYYLVFYATANHTKLESFERDREKGILFLICDEEPYWVDKGHWRKNGITPQMAKDVFGDNIEKEISMLECVKKTAERFEIFIIRPGHTCHGRDRSITAMWQKLLKEAGVNPENVLEIENTDDIISTMTAVVGRIHEVDEDELENILGTKIVSNTKAIVPSEKGGSLVAKGEASANLPKKKGEVGSLIRRR